VVNLADKDRACASVSDPPIAEKPINAAQNNPLLPPSVILDAATVPDETISMDTVETSCPLDTPDVIVYSQFTYAEPDVNEPNNDCPLLNIIQYLPVGKGHVVVVVLVVIL